MARPQRVFHGGGGDGVESDSVLAGEFREAGSGAPHQGDDQGRIDVADRARAPRLRHESLGGFGIGAAEGARLGVEIGAMMMQIHKAGGAGIGPGEDHHALPIGGELLPRGQRRRQGRQDEGVVDALPMPVERVDQRLLVREIAVDRAGGDPRPGSDFRHRDPRRSPAPRRDRGRRRAIGRAYRFRRIFLCSQLLLLSACRVSI